MNDKIETELHELYTAAEKVNSVGWNLDYLSMTGKIEADLRQDIAILSGMLKTTAADIYTHVNQLAAAVDR